MGGCCHLRLSRIVFMIVCSVLDVGLEKYVFVLALVVIYSRWYM